MANYNSVLDNPYVGPRPYTQEEAAYFFGRDRDARDLLSLVISERLVLFSAQSGAGKSSLLQARLLPDLVENQFNVLPIARIGGQQVADTSQIENVYVLQLLLSLERDKEAPQTPTELAQLTLRQYLQREKSHANLDSPDDSVVSTQKATLVLIIDQFEEIFTAQSDHWQEREAFFQQLDEAITEDPLLRIVLTMREDYAMALDPYANLVNGRFQARYYMQRMEEPAALVATQQPAKLAGRDFVPGVAQTLVNNLRQLRTQEGKQLGQFVEPVQLQVVCHELWQNLQSEPGTPITQADVDALGDVDQALAQFYERTVTAVAANNPDITELDLRDWFETVLITPSQTRGMAIRGDDTTEGIPNSLVAKLEEKYLIRAEVHSRATWYELVHDRFIAPIIQANQAWRDRQPPIVRDAFLWRESGFDEGKLYQGTELTDAQSQAFLGQLVERFLAVSQHTEKERLLSAEQAQAVEAAARANKIQRILLVIIIILILVGILVLLALASRAQANSAQRSAHENRQEAIAQQTVSYATAAAVDRQKSTAEAESGNAVAQKNAAEATSQAAGMSVVIAETTREWAVTRQSDMVATRDAADILLSTVEAELTEAEAETESAQEEQVEAETDRRVQILRALPSRIKQVAAANQIELALLLVQEAQRFSEETGVDVQAEMTRALLPLMNVTYTGQSYVGNDTPLADVGVAFNEGRASRVTAVTEDHRILLWSGNGLHEAPTVLETGPVDFATVSENGRFAATVLEDGTIRLWDLTTNAGQEVRTIAVPDQLTEVVLSADGNLLAYATNTGRVGFWRTNNPDHQGELAKGFQTQGFWNLTFSPDGRYLSADTTSQQVVWQISERSVSYQGPRSLTETPPVYTADDGWRISLDPDRRINIDHTIWSLSLRTDWSVPEAALTQLILSPDNTTLAIILDNDIGLWQLPPLDVGMSPGTYTLGSRFYELLEGHQGPVRQVVFYDADQTIVSSSEDGTVRVWYPYQHNVKHGQNTVVSSSDLGEIDYTTIYLQGVKYLALSENEESFLVVQPDYIDNFRGLYTSPNNVLLWSLPSLMRDEAVPPIPLKNDLWDARTAAASPDGRWLAVAIGVPYEPGTIYIWDKNNLEASPFRLLDHRRPINSLQFSPDSRYLVSAGGDGPNASSPAEGQISDNNIRLWDLDNLSEPALLTPEFNPSITTLAFSADGRQLALGSLDGTILLHAWEEFPDRETHRLTEHENAITTIVFAKDGQYMVSADETGRVLIWNLDNLEKPLHEFAELRQEETAVTISPDSNYLAISAPDGQHVQLWSLANLSASNLEIFAHNTPIRALQFTKDGNYLMTAAADAIRFWPTVQQIQADSTSLIGRRLTCGEWQTYIGYEEPYFGSCDE